jgi:NAD(P)H-hydrate epimerase
LVPKNARGVVARRLPLEAMSEDLPMGNTLLLKRVNAFHPDVIAIGPGLGTEPRTARLVHVLLKESRIPIVLDADGLNVFKKAPRALADRRAPLIITPHPGELSRLLGTSISWINRQRASAVTLAARRFNGVCLLKGDATLVSDGVRIWKNPTGNPGMGSGGMGDVLTGVTAALWAQRIKRGHTNGLEAAALAAYVHGRAGDLAAKKISKIGFLASDLADFLPRSLAHL